MANGAHNGVVSSFGPEDNDAEILGQLVAGMFSRPAVFEVLELEKSDSLDQLPSELQEKILGKKPMMDLDFIPINNVSFLNNDLLILI